MLKEIPRVQQIPGENARRWFFSHEQDLLVWYNESGEPIAFQLCYGKYHDEHALRWKSGRGFTHDRVDDGESAGIGKEAPILISDGAFPASEVLKRFLELSSSLPSDLVQFVAARLREHHNYQADA
jgi:hypothetical protein